MKGTSLGRTRALGLAGYALCASTASAEGPPSPPAILATDPIRAPDVALDHERKQAVEALASVERAILAARDAAARLDERAALSRLAEAEDDASRALVLRGSHAWLAEIAVQRGVIAAQAGMEALARSAFERAASLDPARQLGQAEATPQTVAVARAARTRVLGRAPLPLALQIAPADASVNLDGVAIGREVPSARGGPHVLLVEAPGHRPYAGLIELSDGPRALLSVVLDPLPGSPPIVAENLAKPRKTSGPRVQPAIADTPSAGPVRPPRESGHKRWPWWLAGALAVVGAATAGVLLAKRTDTHASRTLVVDPGQPP